MSQRTLVRSGHAPLDRQIGGLLPGRPHLLSGAPGTGKSVSCLEFLDVAVQDGQVGVLLTHDDPKDVLATAEFLGMDLEPALADGRFVLLRFQLDFPRRFGRAPTPDEAFSELERLMGERKPARLAIDSVLPFLEGGGASSNAIFSLTAFLERLNATTLITYPGDLSGLYDRRLEPLMQRAGGFFHLSSQPQGRRRGVVEIRKLRFEAPSMAPVQFRIEPGAGFVQEGQPNEPETPLLDEIRRRLLVVNMSAPFPDDLLRSASRDFEVTVRAGVPAAFSELVRAGVGAVLLNVQRDVIRDALELVRELRRSDVRTPILVVTPYMLRSTDRTRALRAGADDFVSLNLPHEEILARVTAIVRRGRSAARVEAEAERPLLAQPRSADGRYEALPAERFSTALSAYLSRAQAPFFTLLELSPSNGDGAGVASLAMETARVDGGDLVGLAPGGAVLFADGARPRELEGLQQRLRERWAERSGGALAITALSLPADEDRIRGMFARTDA